MRLTCDLYGCSQDDMETVSKAIEQAFVIKMQARESSFKGDYYTYDFPNKSYESIGVRLNLDPHDKLLAELEFPDYPILVNVNSTRANEIQDLLMKCVANIKLLKREDVELKDSV